MALTCLGTEADAAHPIVYLDRYLLRPDLNYDHATRFAETGGLW